MTGREFSEVDIDLLADYVGGALDGTPDEAAVARLVADDPAWAEAYAELSGSTSAIRADLATWGATAEPMPAEVTGRITAALEQQRPHPAPVGVPDADAGPRRRATRARRWWPAWGTPVAIAAGVAVVAGLGISQLGQMSSQNDEGAATSAEAPEARDNSAAGAGLAAPAVAASGRDYRSAALANAQAPLPQPLSAAQPDDEKRARITAAGPLDRLTDTAALGECLGAIARDHPQGVTTVEVVDYAAVDGSPALVVFFTDGTGARWVWAAGPDCGLAAWGADTRGSAKIG